jgi:drug/metabolite transporter (DMT)-like permease
MTGSLQSDRPLLGIVLVMIAMFLFSATDAMAKWLVAGYSVFQIIAFRGVLSLAVLTPPLLRGRGRAALRTPHVGMQMLRGVLGLVSLVSFVVALREVPLADAAALGFSGSLMLTALSAVILREPVSIRRWGAILVGFAGVLVIVQPGSTAFQWSSLLVLLSALCYALMMIATRWLTRSVGNLSIVFYHSLVAAVVGLAALPFVWVDPGPLDLALLVATGLAGIVGHIVVAQAYRLAPVATLAPFDYSALLWATLAGIAIWGESPGSMVWLGAAILVAAGLYIIYGERKPTG